MNATPVKRKLAAILAADAVGYSRMMAADEEGTLKILSAHRAVIDGIIEFHEGRIVGTAGDSVLAEFASAVEAVRCAVEIQDALKTRNDALPEDRRIGLGCVDVRGEQIDTVEQIVARVEEARRHVDAARLSLNPDCGFAPGSAAAIPIDEAYAKLQREAQAAALLREQYG